MLHRVFVILVAAAAAMTARADDGAALFARHCLPCHGADAVAPVSLARSELLRRNRTLAALLVRDGTMPPALARANPHLASRALSSRERDAIVAAIERGEVGSPSPTERAARSVSVVAPTAPWTMPATGGAQLRTFPASVESQRIRGIRFADRAALAHAPIRYVSLAADPRGSIRRMEAADGSAGIEAMGNVGAMPSGALGALSRVATEFLLPAGFHVEVPAGDVAIETLCEPIGREAPVFPQIALIPANAADTRAVRAIALPVRQLSLEADACRSFEVRQRIPTDVELVAIMVKGGAFLRTVELDVAGERVLDVPDFRMAFNEPWILRAPLKVAAGSEFVARFGFDNTRANPQQPCEPPVDVAAGLPPFGEDAIAVLLVADAVAAPTQPTSPSPSASP